MLTVKQRKKRKIKILIGLIAVLSVIILFFIYTDSRLRTVISEYSQSRAKIILLETTDKAVYKILNDNKINYENIVSLSNNDENQIKSLQIDTVKINSLKSQITAEIAKLLSNREEFILSVPIGTIIGNEYTVGRGPQLKIKMKLSAAVNTSFNSNFTGAGINQVLHQIVIKVDYNGYILIPWFKSTFKESTNYIAAQTVIVGVVPDAFTNVIESDPTRVTGDIFDFSAHLQ